MVYVETSRGHDLSAWRPDIGAAIPMLPTAMGRTWLAQAPAPLREDVLARLRTAEPAHWTAHAADVAQALVELPEKGYCVSRGAWRPDVHAVSVPVTLPQDGETLVFNCGVLTTRLAPRGLERSVAPKLVALVREVEAEMERVG
jgi:DNA-binding IclR family transcriptional regulator